MSVFSTRVKNSSFQEQPQLRGETLGRIAEATGIRTANLSVWLRGKEQVISAKRLVGLLHHPGVEGGRLRTDVLHQ